MEFQIRLTDKLVNFNSYVEVKQFQENGVVVGEYRMRLNDLLDSLSNSSAGGIESSTPFLPKNCIKLITKDNGYEVFIELPKRQWQVNMADKDLMLGFPRLLLNYSISGSRIYSLKIVALKDGGAITGDTDIYYFPYPNVHHTSGAVCMGMNAFPEVKNLTQIETMHFLFFTAPFGMDYGAMAVGMDVEKLIKACENKDFDDNLLIPSRQTFSEFFRVT